MPILQVEATQLLFSILKYIVCRFFLSSILSSPKPQSINTLVYNTKTVELQVNVNQLKPVLVSILNNPNSINF